MSQILEALHYAWLAAIEKYKEIRYYQRGGNPDELPF